MKTMFGIALALIFAVSGLAVGQDKPAEAKEQASHKLPLKQLEVFHDVLHPLVHDAYPNNDFDAIREKLDVLLEKAMAIDKAKLPRKYSGVKTEFKKQSALLVTQLEGMVKAASKIDDEFLGVQFVEMHETFERMIGILH